MRSQLLWLSLLCFPLLTFTQQTINANITHDGLQREYILYIPASYSSGTPVPLVLNFHGYTSNADQQMWYGDFRSIADTAGFIIAHPEGTLDNTNTSHFNVGWGGSTVDDIGFTSDLIDSVAAEYSINPDRVYSTGMSNGGFMSYELACKLSNKIAAIASVTGSITPWSMASCNTQHPTPVMEIHGTADPVVPYTGDSWTTHIDSTIKFWVDLNNCDPSPLTTSMPDINPIDGSTITHYAYDNGDNSVSVELFKVALGAHTWPGSILAGAGTNQDINASDEIWKFFSRYDINGLIGANVIEDQEKEAVLMYPNPASSFLSIETGSNKEIDFKLSSLTGQSLLSGSIQSEQYKLDISKLSLGIYLLKLGNRTFKIFKTD